MLGLFTCLVGVSVPPPHLHGEKVRYIFPSGLNEMGKRGERERVNIRERD
jgi:hypothetical protein